MLDVLHCVLIDSPEALNMMKEDHIKVIISLLEKHGRDKKVILFNFHPFKNYIIFANFYCTDQQSFV